MDKFKNIYDNIKDRFSNPLIFSFICSWLIVNWQITIGLVLFDSEQIKNEGFVSIFEFVNDKINVEKSILYPLYFSLLYTAFIPIIRNIIQAFYTWTAKWGGNWNIYISKGVNIPFEKYIKLRDEYNRRSEMLEEIISKENEYLDKYNKLNTDFLSLKTQTHELSQRLADSNNFIQHIDNYNVLNGYWTNKYVDTLDGKNHGTEDVYIDNGKYYIIEKFGEKKHVFDIRNFYFNIRSKTITFVKENPNQEASFVYSGGKPSFKLNINILKVERDGLLVGVENSTTQIEYSKKIIIPEVIEPDSPVKLSV